jgi:uncharacterized protein
MEFCPAISGISSSHGKHQYPWQAERSSVMGKGYAAIAFTGAVRDEQERIGSRRHFATVEQDGRDDSRLGEAESAFLATRESFYLSSVSETGWPYIQHRGGPPGFVQVLEDGAALAFADLAGNRQHVSIGNLHGTDRVALFFMDYAERHRLKLFGHARLMRPEEAPELAAHLAVPARGRVEHIVVIRVAGFEWNCSQHIPRLLPLAAVQEGVGHLVDRVAALEAALAQCQGAAASQSASEG